MSIRMLGHGPPTALPWGEDPMGIVGRTCYFSAINIFLMYPAQKMDRFSQTARIAGGVFPINPLMS